MIKMTLTEAARLLKIKNTESAEFHGISIDSRTVSHQELFIAIAGKNHDGHQFLEEAKEKGASAALVQKKMSSKLPQLLVSDVYLALGKLAQSWRQRFTLPVIGITGSNGKTTLKNMIAAMLTAHCKDDPQAILATFGTYNNHLGLPLTLIRLNEKHRYAVIEMGMNHLGEIDYLTKLTQPQIAVISNAGSSHLAGVGSIENVARAKAEIFHGLSANGIAILNRDDHFFPYWQKQIGTRDYLTFGFHREADVRPRDKQHPYQIITPTGLITIHLPLLGRFNLLNALAGIATLTSLNIETDAIVNGLKKIKAEPRRLQCLTLPNGATLIDDSYNANPDSLQAALEVLSTFAGRKLLLLGDMSELGKHEINFHKHAGEKIKKAGIDYLFTYGNLSQYTAQAFGQKAQHFTEPTLLAKTLQPLLTKGSTLLVKGSRTMKLEKVIALLTSGVD